MANKWIIQEHLLDPQQKEFRDNWNANSPNAWIKGFAGSGKSVLLAYVAKKISADYPNARVIMVVFTQSLIEMYKAAFREIGVDVKIDTFYGFMKSYQSYDYILCDEVQDLTPRVIREMSSRSKHVIVAGDANQSIYECDPKWHEDTVKPNAVGTLINGRSVELRIIHRLSKTILSAVRDLCSSLTLFDDKIDATKKDTQVRLYEASSKDEEIRYVFDNALKVVNFGGNAAVLFPMYSDIVPFVNGVLRYKGKPAWEEKLNRWGKLDYGSMNSHLRRNGINMQYVGNGYGNFAEGNDCINIMTYYSVKGLDFDNVFIPFASSSLYISPNEEIAKTLFMVAMTRSRNDLYISYTGSPCEYIHAFRSRCNKVNEQKASNTNNPFGF